MKPSLLKRLFGSFWSDERGTAALETVIMAPFLTIGLFFSYEAYGAYRQQSLTDKATYTIADILSREQNNSSPIDDTYIDNAKTLFNDLTRSDIGQLRITVVRRHLDPDNNVDFFELRWSELRGQGAFEEMTQEMVENADDFFPAMLNGQEMILVESRSLYRPSVTLGGVFREFPIEARMFMTLRFAPQLCHIDICNTSNTTS
ncbi:MAG: pilus assembly protein [Roseovarius sp.]|uniref:TadE/TadG family type IV pilus assembly protein n=1 Tax=Roseovarius sp. TaxID=1486281 RepID=UPI0032EB3643